MNDLFDLSGRVGIVSGASGRLGIPMVEALVSAGMKVVAVGRSIESLEGAAARWGAGVELRACDVTSAEWPALIDGTGRAEGRLDLLINNAHIGHGDSSRTATRERFEEAWALAVTAAWEGIRAARPFLAAGAADHGDASVINVGSMYGVVAPDLALYPTEADRNPPYYGAAKAGLLQLTRYSAAELGPEGIRVNSITPGPFPDAGGAQDAVLAAELGSRTMLGRVGTPDEVRTAVLFLASPNSRFVTGSNVVIDGGWTAH